MSNQKQRKAKQKAKRESMRTAAERKDAQTEGLDEVLSEIVKDDDSATAKEAVSSALAEARAGEEVDPRLLGLFRDFKRYRVIIVAIVAVGFAVLLAAMGLYNAGRIGEDMQNQLIVYANIIIVMAMVIAFGRVRPIREDINAWNKVNNIALKESGGKHGATKADIDKIFAARSRNRRVPPTPEFKRVRRIWYALVIAGGALMVAAVVVAHSSMGDITVPLIILVCSYILLFIAVYIERAKMKPMREAWAAQYDAKTAKASRKNRS